MPVQVNREAGPIGVYADNPHYYARGGRPILLITSAEHYGAVINAEFDYEAYLNTLQEFGMNYTRIYPGAYTEVAGMFTDENTLAPAPGKLIVPWARSSADPAKFDLKQWDEGYFRRLRSFIEAAQQRGIVVEICLFNCQYNEGWPASPLHAPNNVQGIGDCEAKDVQTLLHPELVRVQEDYVRKIAQEVNEFDDIILEDAMSRP